MAFVAIQDIFSVAPSWLVGAVGLQAELEAAHSRALADAQLLFSQKRFGRLDRLDDAELIKVNSLRSMPDRSTSSMMVG